MVDNWPSEGDQLSHLWIACADGELLQPAKDSVGRELWVPVEFRTGSAHHRVAQKLIYPRPGAVSAPYVGRATTERLQVQEEVDGQHHKTPGSEESLHCRQGRIDAVRRE